MSEEHSHHPNYVKIWAVLVILLVVSVLGPMLGIKAVTLITAFGIGIMAMVARKAAQNVDLHHVELIGVYWHFVDLVWIFLFPLLYIAK